MILHTLLKTRIKKLRCWLEYFFKLLLFFSHQDWQLVRFLRSLCSLVNCFLIISKRSNPKWSISRELYYCVCFSNLTFFKLNQRLKGFLNFLTMDLIGLTFLFMQFFILADFFSFHIFSLTLQTVQFVERQKIKKHVHLFFLKLWSSSIVSF